MITHHHRPIPYIPDLDFFSGETFSLFANTKPLFGRRFLQVNSSLVCWWSAALDRLLSEYMLLRRELTPTTGSYGALLCLRISLVRAYAFAVARHCTTAHALARKIVDY